jgi:hypothetical protein
MIYDDKFIEYLKDSLGEPIKVKTKNIIAPCPWCEFNQKKDHYHLYISTESPIFHCFHSDCGVSGTIKKLFRKIEGKDISEKYVNPEKVKEYIKDKIRVQENVIERKFLWLPPITEGEFKAKEQYLRERFKFSNIDLKQVKGLILNVKSFMEINKIPIDEKMFRMIDYLHQNFVGFLTENQSVVMFRNIDRKASFNHFKYQVQESNLLDYYKITGNNINSNHIVLAEGIFDIFSESIFDSLGIKNNVRLYASALSTSYESLIKSIVFYEQEFRLNVTILSDNNIGLDFYRKIKRFNKHIIDSLDVYYNKSGKDFNVTPINPEKFIL